MPLAGADRVHDGGKWQAGGMGGELGWGRDRSRDLGE